MYFLLLPYIFVATISFMLYSAATVHLEMSIQPIHRFLGALVAGALWPLWLIFLFSCFIGRRLND